MAVPAGPSGIKGTVVSVRCNAGQIGACSEKRIARLSLEVRNIKTGDTKFITTNGEGEFSLEVPAGTYEITGYGRSPVGDTNIVKVSSGRFATAKIKFF